MEDEQLRCNICEVVIGSSQAKDHALTSSHESRQKVLEEELKDLRKENYRDDSSVIFQWENSI